MNFDRQKLIRAAMMARENAYAPFSGFRVGAALLCGDGAVYTGCNIENSSYSPTLCAERCAVAGAVSDGRRDFAAIAIVGSPYEHTTPCGVCRQFLYEFCDEDFPVICAKNGTDYIETTLGELFPKGFRLKGRPDAAD